MHGRESLIYDLKALGLQLGDRVIVHNSLKAVGSIDPEGTSGAEVFLQALRDCVGPEGLVIIPAHTWDHVREAGSVFDMRDVPCLGVVSKIAASMAEKAWEEGNSHVVRSKSPSHGVVAFGRDAKTFASADDNCYEAAGWTGCMGELYRQDAKILLVGVTHKNNTFLHTAELGLKLPQRLSEERRITLRDYDGRVTEGCYRMHIRYLSRFFWKYNQALEEMGVGRHGLVGDASSILCSARDCYHAVEAIWQHNRLDLDETEAPFDLSWNK